MTVTTGRARWLRVAAAICVVVASFVWLTATRASGLGPDKTAWYDNLGLQGTTGETTPSVAAYGQLEVEYAPASVSEPTVTLPSTPVTAPTLPPSAPVGVPVPAGGQVGGSTVGDTLAFAEVDYPVPLQAGGQTIDPSSIQAVLTLTLDPSTSTDVQSGDIEACPTTNNLWAAGADQEASQASPYDCAAGQGVSGDYDAATNTLTFDLSGTQEYQAPSGPTGDFSLALVPGTSPTGVFTAVIDPPSSTSFAVTNESPASNPDDNVAAPSTVPVTIAPVPTSVPVSGFQAESSGLTGSSAAPLSPVTPTPAPTPTTVAPTATPSAVALGAPTTSDIVSGLSSGYQRTVAVILLMALGAGLWMAASMKRHTPKSLRPVHAAEA
jgi:hypothetical protein